MHVKTEMWTTNLCCTCRGEAVRKLSSVPLYRSADCWRVFAMLQLRHASDWHNLLALGKHQCSAVAYRTGICLNSHNLLLTEVLKNALDCKKINKEIVQSSQVCLSYLRNSHQQWAAPTHFGARRGGWVVSPFALVTAAQKFGYRQRCDEMVSTWVSYWTTFTQLFILSGSKNKQRQVIVIISLHKRKRSASAIHHFEMVCHQPSDSCLLGV